MFKRKLKIKQISVCCTDQYFFTVGLGSDGNCYLWDKIKLEWVPHQVVEVTTDATK